MGILLVYVSLYYENHTLTSLVSFDEYKLHKIQILSFWLCRKSNNIG